MTTVATVRGPIDAADLGRTYMHEHIFVLTAEVQQNFPEEWGDEETRVADAVAKLGALAASGVRTIVDPTVIGLGRYIPRIQRVAEQVPDLNIVVATGCYTYHDVPFFFHYRTPAVGALLGREEPEPMVPLFVADITEGIAGTGVRAGMLKCAIDEDGLTPGVERIMRAVARTHLATGCPITVHTHPGTERGLDVQRVMAEEGSTRAPWCSATAATRPTSTTWVRWPRPASGWAWTASASTSRPRSKHGPTPWSSCAGGATPTGWCCPTTPPATWTGWTPRRFTFLPQWHYLHIEQDVLPYLRDHGVTEEQITTMLVDNPRRIFEGA